MDIEDVKKAIDTATQSHTYGGQGAMFAEAGIVGFILLAEAVNKHTEAVNRLATAMEECLSRIDAEG